MRSIRLIRRVQITSLGLALALTAAPASAGTVVIDIGHSQKDQGSKSATGYGEYLYNRALAINVAQYIVQYGHKVDMMNLEGQVSSLAARPARASELRADLFVSLHHDSIQPQLMKQRYRYRGYSVWTSGSHPASRQSLICGRTIATTMLQSGMTPALFHAEKIPGEGHELLDPHVGHYRRDGLAVLRLSKTPAVLIEAGVIVNPTEESYLVTPQVRDSIARAIATGILSCLGYGKIEGKKE
jgi:N-acetylmuramoyl-L-alanine amidase